MKNLVLILLIIIIFFACAVLGYQFALNNDNGRATQVSDPREQHRLIVIHVDALDSASPRIVSVWFLSLFFHEGLPPTISLAKIFPASDALTSQVMERAFSLNRDNDPPATFWQTIRAQNIQWDDYMVLDQVTVNRVFGWILGPGDYNWVNTALQENPDEVKRLLTQACEGLGGIDNRETQAFSWGDLVPVHFHSRIPMEEALAYWEQITKSKEPVRCDVVVASGAK